MRVILLKDVENLGKKHEIKEIKAGFARNFLIPRGQAKPATREALKWLGVQKEIEEKKAEGELKKFQDFASSLDGQEVSIAVKVNPEGRLFESITAQKISDKLKGLGFDVKKNQLDLSQPIKELGEFPIKLKLPHNLESEIKVIVTEEK
ncbi:MAG: 50S ribosomal protein L9 [Candidatus Wildermuthbacteria bacterium]|nr:50S ribosomal protein L9 [Candidatus Wildermuthbacteria bacterium]